MKVQGSGQYGTKSTRSVHFTRFWRSSVPVAFEARLEVVVTDANTSFLGTFMHRRLSRAVVREGLLVKVSTATLLFLLRGYVVVLYISLCPPLKID